MASDKTRDASSVTQIPIRQKEMISLCGLTRETERERERGEREGDSATFSFGYVVRSTPVDGHGEVNPNQNSTHARRDKSLVLCPVVYTYSGRGRVAVLNLSHLTPHSHIWTEPRDMASEGKLSETNTRVSTFGEKRLFVKQNGSPHPSASGFAHRKRRTHRVFLFSTIVRVSARPAQITYTCNDVAYFSRPGSRWMRLSRVASAESWRCVILNHTGCNANESNARCVNWGFDTDDADTDDAALT